MYPKTRLLALVCAVLLTGAAAAAQSVSVFGLDIGRPFAIPQCGFKKVSKTLNLYDFSTSVVCYQRTSASDAGTPISANDTVYIRWPRGSEPELVAGYSLLAGVIDGNLESVGFNTLGVISQERDLKALTEKFGAPATSLTPTVQNGYGATAQIVGAEWHLDNVTVHFNSAENGLDHGFVRVETEKSIADRTALLEKLHASKQKL